MTNNILINKYIQYQRYGMEQQDIAKALHIDVEYLDVLDNIIINLQKNRV